MPWAFETAHLDDRTAAGAESPHNSRSFPYYESIRSISIFGSGSVALSSSSNCSSLAASTVSSSSFRSRVSSSGSSPLRWAATASRLGAYQYQHELDKVAERMFQDGYMHDLIQSMPGLGLASVLQRWFSELDVNWVLDAGEASFRELDLFTLQDFVERWIRALLLMVRLLCSWLPEHRRSRNKLAAPAIAGAITTAFRSWFAISRSVESSGQHERSVFLSWLAQASICKMLSFVDALATAAAVDRAPRKLPGMLLAYGCIADASPTVLALLQQASDPAEYQVLHVDERCHVFVFEEMRDAFMRKSSILSQAIWSTMEEVKTSLLACDDHLWLASQAGDVHKTTRSAMRYVRLLWDNDGAVSSVLYDLHFGNGEIMFESQGFSLLVSLILETVSALQDWLEKESELVADAGLRPTFLLNNAHFISQRVESLDLPSWARVDDRTEQYVQNYLDVSWAPVLRHLHHDAASRRYRYSSLAKFESKFHRTYAEQKLWKVPNPQLRQWLRKAVIQRVVVEGYTRYLQELPRHGKSLAISVNGRSTPQDMEELLAELFEG